MHIPEETIGCKHLKYASIIQLYYVREVDGKGCEYTGNIDVIRLSSFW